MPDTVTVNGVPTWYDVRGDGEPLVLFHGGMTDARCFAGNLDALAEQFRLYLPERRGHGHTPDVEGPISHDLMAADMIEFIETVVGGPVHLAGYSDGAVVALLLAHRRPDLVRKLVLISGAYDHSGWLMTPEPGGEIPEVITRAYAEVAPHPPEHLQVVLAKLAASAAAEQLLTTEDLARIGVRTLVVAADDDIISLEHTLALYRGIPDSELAVVPGTSHALLEEKPLRCREIVGEFLRDEAVPTWIPIRRAG
ncbi:alpha/beta hydrolase [Crossiella sp. SN42]|uniref:alpha/beta fold hydrolase n=1 Tax=Crossiella sp. SN42 TaxID=2944808 RepID=UPI00207CA0DE|nr:alpha/beta hydrolase [Crossiella sp. SN42]MCO1576082.1 alpha/beta hydrolase [Crossiella sp. SN42]